MRAGSTAPRAAGNEACTGTAADRRHWGALRSVRVEVGSHSVEFVEGSPGVVRIERDESFHAVDLGAELRDRELMVVQPIRIGEADPVQNETFTPHGNHFVNLDLWRTRSEVMKCEHLLDHVDRPQPDSRSCRTNC
jgi:hypothetical protein